MDIEKIKAMDDLADERLTDIVRQIWMSTAMYLEEEKDMSSEELMYVLSKSASRLICSYNQDGEESRADSKMMAELIVHFVDKQETYYKDEDERLRAEEIASGVDPDTIDD